MAWLGAALPAINTVIERIIPDKNAQAQAKANLAQMALSGELQQTLAETQSAAQIITAEAQSQSWIARNVRPLLLLVWGLLITANQIIPTVARLWVPNLQPLALDPWVYKLTAIGYTGYVTARTWEKVTDSDK